MSAGRDRIRMRPGFVHQVEPWRRPRPPHEGVGDADRDVEVGEVSLVFCVDEFLDVG